MNKFIVMLLLGLWTLEGDCLTCKQKLSVRTVVKKYVMCIYDRTVHPNLGGSTDVELKMILKFFTYNMHDSTISIHSWVPMSWIDSQLSWNPEERGRNITHFHLPSDDIWVPDLSIHNGADSSSTNSFNPVSCLIHSTGKVMCMPSIRNDALCSPNLAKFPFDVQNCTLSVGSLLHPEESVGFNLSKPAVSLEEYEENGEWKLTKVWTSQTAGRYFDGKVAVPLVNFHFLIKRQSAAQICMVLVPALVMIIITLTVLCLSPDETDRVCLICVNSLIHSMHLHHLAWQIPANGQEVPLLLSFGKDSLLLSNFTLVLTVLQRRLIRIKSESPVWVSKLVSGIGTNQILATVFGFDQNPSKKINNLEEENGENPMENSQTKGNEFLTLSRALDRLCLIVYSIVYLTMFIAFIL